MRSSEQMERQVPDKKLFVAAATTVPLYKRTILANLAAGTSYVVTLPNVSEAEGRKFAVSATTMATGGGTTGRLQIDFSDGGAAADTTGISTSGVEVEFESSGFEWLVTR